MNVIICFPYLDGIGGAERMVAKLAKKFNAPIYAIRHDRRKTYGDFAELEVRIVGKSAFDAPLSAFSALDRTKAISQSAAAGFRYRGLKIKEDYDVISAHLPPSEWVRSKNERVCWHWHGMGFARKPEQLFSRQMGIAERLAYWPGVKAYSLLSSPIHKKIEKITACSSFINRDVEKSTGRMDGEVIWTGVDERAFVGGDYGKYFFYPGRITPQKRMEFAIEAFRLFGRRGWKLVIAGPVASDPTSQSYFECLKGQCRGLAVEFRTGISQEELIGLYANCRAMLFPPKLEGSGTVLLEAMSASKPCIVVGEGGPPEVIADGKNGFVVGSPAEMAERMGLLADDVGECERMGREGRKLVLANYTWKVFLGRMEKAFRETARM